tara:strand:- start:41 stop:355 length:315 start_codon:yes stop_codon:yes gene_type:complete
MRLLITLTILLFSFTIQAQEDACKKAKDAFKGLISYIELNNMSVSDIEPTYAQVISAVDKNRNFSDVLKSMYDNKTIDIKVFTATTYMISFTKFRLICEGKYSE